MIFWLTIHWYVFVEFKYNNFFFSTEYLIISGVLSNISTIPVNYIVYTMINQENTFI